MGKLLIGKRLPPFLSTEGAFIYIFVKKMSSNEVGQLIDIGDENTTTENSELKEVKEELGQTKKRLDDALSEVAVAQILQENLTSVERQKVRY